MLELFILFGLIESTYSIIIKFWKHVRKITNYWRKWKFGIGFYFGPILVVVYSISTRSKFTSFDNLLELLSIYTAVAAFITALLVGVIDFIMLLSDWYANKIEKAKETQEYIAKEVVRQRTLMDLIEAEQRGLSLEEIISELKLPKKIVLLDFQTLKPFNLVIKDRSGLERDIKDIIWLTITLRENGTYSLSAISKGEDINGLPDLTNNLMLISEDEYKRIDEICKNL
jgi:hypothetical protein